MMLLSILIVYGLTLIIVQGKIFNKSKILLSQLIEYLKKYYDIPQSDINNMILNKHILISENHINLYNNILIELNDSKNKTKLEELSDILASLIEKIKILILEKRKYKWGFKTSVYLLTKIQELTECMMCTGFWAGIFLSIISMLFNISICGCSLNLVTTQDDISTIITVFLLGTLYSGTTWAINSLVDFFVEIKESLKSFLDKKTTEKY